MNKYLLFIMCLGFISCEEKTPIIDDYPDFGIVIDVNTYSDYEVDGDYVYAWLLIDETTYNATYLNIEPLPPVVSSECAFIDLSDNFAFIILQSPEFVEVIEERISDNITYQKCKMCIPVSYNNYTFEIYYLAERAFVYINENEYYFPVPDIDATLLYNKEKWINKVLLNDIDYDCYSVEIGIDIICGNKTVFGSTSFMALDEQN